MSDNRDVIRNLNEVSMNKTIKLALGCCALALSLPSVRASEEALQTTEENQERVLDQIRNANVLFKIGVDLLKEIGGGGIGSADKI